MECDLNKEQIKEGLSHFFGNDDIMLDELIAVSTYQSYPAGKTIFRMQDNNRDLFYILNGKAKAIIHSIDGQEVWIADFEKYFTFGELAFFGNFERTADIVAITGIQALSFTQDSFLKLMEKHGSIGIKMSQLLAKRIKRTTNRRFELSAFSAISRIHNELWRRAEEDEDGLMVISPIPAFTTIAKKVGSTRETVSRTVNEMESQGNIIRKDGKLIITSLPNITN